MDSEHLKDMVAALRYAMTSGTIEMQKRAAVLQRAAAIGNPNQPAAGVSGVAQAVFRWPPSLHEQLRVRLRLRDLDELGVKLQIIEDMGTVFVFVVKDGKPATLEDTTEMFPSDQLVTQLRMLAK